MTREGLWSGYYTLLIPDSASLREAESSLQSMGISHIIHKNNAEISISDYNGLKKKRLIDIPEDLRDDDPRIDPFIRSLPRLFTSGTYNIIYIKKTLPAFLLYARLLKRFSIPGWIFADFHILQRILPPTFILFFIFFTVLLEKRSRYYFLFTGIPLLFLSFLCSWESILLYSLFQSSVYALLKLKSQDRIKYFPLILLSGAFTLYLVYLFFNRGVIQGAVSLILIAINVLSLLFVSKEKTVERAALNVFEHTIFDPLPTAFINIENYLSFPDLSAGKIIFPWRYIFAILFFIIPLSLFVPQKRAYPVSIPSRHYSSIDQNWNLNSLNQLYFSADSQRFPDISQMTAHLFYQKNYIYQEPFGQIFTQGTFMVPSYQISQKEGIKKQKELEVMYDLPWTKQWIQDNIDTGLYRLIFGNGKIVPIIYADFFNFLSLRILNRTTIYILVVIIFFMFLLDFFTVIAIRKVLKRISIRRAA